jgi:HK97 gp10 family phage protein
MATGIKIEGTDKIISLFSYIKGELPHSATTVLGTVARNVSNQMQKTAPVDTGFLRGSISYSVSGTKAEVVSNAEYSGFVNYGTKKSPAQEYFSDGIDLAKLQLPKMMMDEIKKDIASRK